MSTSIRNVNIDANRKFDKWEHNSCHRHGVAYDNDAVRNKFATPMRGPPTASSIIGAGAAIRC